MSEGDTWTTVGLERQGRVLRRRRSSESLGTEVLRFNEGSLVHLVQYDNVTAQHVGRARTTKKDANRNPIARLAARATAAGPSLRQRTAVQHERFVLREQLDVTALSSVAFAYRSSSSGDPTACLKFEDSNGGAVVLPIAPTFEQSWSWGALLREALARCGVTLEDRVRAVIDEWCDVSPAR